VEETPEVFFPLTDEGHPLGSYGAGPVIVAADENGENPIAVIYNTGWNLEDKIAW
jgi:hypothetical protein